ncbi:hypothetical protein ABZ879_13415, partial [Streptomyces chartreusis]
MTASETNPDREDARSPATASETSPDLGAASPATASEPEPDLDTGSPTTAPEAHPDLDSGSPAWELLLPAASAPARARGRSLQAALREAVR